MKRLLFRVRTYTAIVLANILFFIQAAIPIPAYAQSPTPTPPSADTLQSEACARNQSACDQFNQDNGSGGLNDQLRQDMERGQVVDLGSGQQNASDWNTAYDTMEFATMILAIAAAIAATTWVFSCVDQPSAWVFFFTSLAFIITEIALVSQSKNAADRGLTILTNVSQQGLDVQAEAIKQAKEQTQQAANHAGSRETATYVIGAFQIVAAVVALVEGILHEIVTIKYPDQCHGAMSFNHKNSPGKDFIATIFNKIFPEAQAGNEGEAVFAALGMIGVLLTIIIAVVTGVKQGFSSGASTGGFARAAIMAVFAGFTIAAAVIIGEKKKQLEERVRKYDELLAQLRLKTENVGPDVRGNDAPPPNSTIQALDGNSLAIDDSLFKNQCVSGGMANGDIKPNPGCKNPSPKIEGNVSIPKNSNIDLPQDFIGNLETPKKMAQDLASGKGFKNSLSSTSVSALAKGAKFKKQLAGKYLDLLKKSGKSSPSLEELERQYRKDMIGMTKNALNKINPKDLSSAMASYMGGTKNSDADKKELDKVLDQLGKNSILGKGGKATNPKMETPKITIGDESGVNSGLIEEIDSAKTLDSLDVNEKDISEDNSASLFLIITNRYRKSAYPKFFNHKNNASSKQGNGP